MLRRTLANRLAATKPILFGFGREAGRRRRSRNGPDSGSRNRSRPAFFGSCPVRGARVTELDIGVFLASPTTNGVCSRRSVRQEIRPAGASRFILDSIDSRPRGLGHRSPSLPRPPSRPALSASRLIATHRNALRPDSQPKSSLLPLHRPRHFSGLWRQRRGYAEPKLSGRRPPRPKAGRLQVELREIVMQSYRDPRRHRCAGQGLRLLKLTQQRTCRRREATEQAWGGGGGGPPRGGAKQSA